MSFEFNPSRAVIRFIDNTAARGPTEAEVAKEVAKDPERAKKIAAKKARK